ncbi:MAG: ATP-binding cassette domain-containing protein [Gemmatimonadota bacterium]|nr:ATP-binding cassette domain-containing protein [Gemmatimonadota bacterium]
MLLFAASHLAKRYAAGVPGCSAAVRVLAHVDLQLTDGSVVGVVGDRASGKTTLVRCVAGLARADAGALRWAPGAERARVVSLAPAALPFETVRDVLSRASADPLVHPERLAAAVDALGLAGLLSQSQTMLTTDERARLALAIGLATGHPLLLLDGTADAIAARERAAVRACLLRHAGSGAAVLLTGRDPAAVSALAGTVLRLADGKLTSPEPAPQAWPARVAEARSAPPAVR